MAATAARPSTAATAAGTFGLIGGSMPRTSERARDVLQLPLAQEPRLARHRRLQRERDAGAPVPDRDAPLANAEHKIRASTKRSRASGEDRDQHGDVGSLDG